MTNKIMGLTYVFVFFFQAEDGIRDLVRSRGLGDVYKRQGHAHLRVLQAFLEHLLGLPDGLAPQVRGVAQFGLSLIHI